jgi:ribosomal protein S27E
MTITEKTAYIKGLLEGLELDEGSKEVKVIKAIVDLLDDMALTVSDLEEGYQDLCDQLDDVDEDLHTLEEDFYDDEEDDEEDEDDLFYEVTCPTCNETICLSEDILLKGEIECPNCGESLEFDFDDLCEEEGCSCHEGHCSCEEPKQ